MVFMKKNKKDEEEAKHKEKKECSDKSDESSYGPDGSSEGNKTGSASSGVMGTSESSSSLTLTKKESRDVFRLRIIVTTFLIMTAVAVCTVVYKVTKNGEIGQFEAQFDGSAQKITESFEAIIVKMSAISGLGVGASDFAKSRPNDDNRKLSGFSESVNKGDSHDRFLSDIVGMSSIAANIKTSGISESVNKGDSQVFPNGTAMSAESVDSGTTWPYLTLSNFQERAMNALELSGAIFVNFAPVVREDQWEAWNKFVTNPENNQWM